MTGSKRRSLVAEPSDMEILHAAGIEGSDATSQLAILRRNTDWSVESIGHYSQPAATVLINAQRKEGQHE